MKKQIMICDKCKTEYSENQKVSPNPQCAYESLSDFKIVLLGKNSHTHGSQGRYDLCPKCAMELLNWLLNQENYYEMEESRKKVT